MPVDNRYTSTLIFRGVIAPPAGEPVWIKADRGILADGQTFDSKVIRCGGGVALVTGIFVSIA